MKSKESKKSSANHQKVDTAQRLPMDERGDVLKEEPTNQLDAEQSGTRHTLMKEYTDDSDYYEEEIMVLADFDMYLNLSEGLDANKHINVLGIDTEHPIVQVDDEMYRGTYDFALGTNVFFEKDIERTETLDPVFETNVKQMYRLVGKTDKVLRMKRIFATKKTEPKDSETNPTNPDGTSSDEEQDVERYDVDMTYEEALNLHLPEGHSPPRHISDKLNGASLVVNRFTCITKVEEGEPSVRK